MAITREEAWAILTEWTDGESLLKHARSVEVVMAAYARKLGHDETRWGITGMLHDADYERFPEEHPDVVVRRLRELGEEEIAYAISAHYTQWEVPWESPLDRGLIASDEMTGFVTACALVRPGGIDTLAPKSVVKKMKDKGFARKVDRHELKTGAELFEKDTGMAIKEHIAFIVDVLRAHKAELGLPGEEG